MITTNSKFIVGREEWVALPDLDIPAIKARIDSGAKTSALHAFNVELYEEAGKNWVKFDIHPIQNNRKITRSCKAYLIDQRIVKSSNGEIERRYVISTALRLGELLCQIEITLTNRDSMGYRMLIGREAMQGRVLVDPESTMLSYNIDDAEVKNLYQFKHINNMSARIVLLASNPGLYSNERIMRAGEQRGHEMIFLPVNECCIAIRNNIPEVYHKGTKLSGVDAVIPRIRPSATLYGCAIVRHFQLMGGVYCLNDANAIERSRDKLKAMQLLAGDAIIKMPNTSFAISHEATKQIIKILGGAPLIIKLLEGTQGTGVVLAETNKAAESVIGALKNLKANVLVQEFVKECRGSDIRCFVIGGKVVGAMQRNACGDEFRANLHLGGTSRPIKLSKEERRVAIAAAKILGLDVAGVDMLATKTGPQVLEVNSSPGLEGIEHATGEDIAGLMIEHIERVVLGKKLRKKS